MVTDDERREVARKLRDYVDLPDDWWQETRAEFYVEKCVFGDVNRHREGELFARLADLMEPSCDRDALLALADEISGTSCDKVDGELTVDLITVWGWAQAIREALGVQNA